MGARSEERRFSAFKFGIVKQKAGVFKSFEFGLNGCWCVRGAILIELSSCIFDVRHRIQKFKFLPN